MVLLQRLDRLGHLRLTAQFPVVHQFYLVQFTPFEHMTKRARWKFSFNTTRLSPLELLDADRLGLVVALGTRRIGVLVEPDVPCRRALGEEEQVGADAGVGVEDAVGQADDGVQVAGRSSSAP
jgi:hypothetical protein